MAMTADLRSLLEGKEVDVGLLARAACGDEALLTALLDEVSPQSRHSKRRYNSFGVLKELGATEPACLYRRWDYLEALLRSGNEPSRYIAVSLLPLLASVDKERRWDGVLEDFIAFTRVPNLPLAGHAIMGLGTVAKERPEYRVKITAALLSLGKARIREERKSLLKAYAVESLGMYSDRNTREKGVISFVRGELHSESPKGRHAAELFLGRNRKRKRRQADR